MPSFRSLATAAALAVSALAMPSPELVRRAQQYGVVINSCTVPGVVAVTFDDGPSIYTENVLDQLAAAGQKATFFMNGQNYGNIYDYASTVQRMVNEGHQVASHTYSHADLATLSNADITSQMIQLEDAFKSILGYFPYYMRPPYLSTNANVLSVLAQLQYVVIQIDIDTKDYENQSPSGIQVAVNNFQNGLSAGGTLSLEHDPLQYTAQTLVPAIIRELANRGLKSVPVGQCLGDPASNWYRTSRDGGSVPSGGSSTPPSSGGSPGASGSPTPDGTCGGASGYICDAGQCCSQYGYCDVGDDYCGAGCQPAFGTCSSVRVSSSAAPRISSSPTARAASSAVAASSVRVSSATASATAAASASVRASSVSAAPSSAASGVVSPDSSCGGTNKYICPAGSCCSQYNYCGTTSEYCGRGCQAAFGTCNASGSSARVSSAVASSRPAASSSAAIAVSSSAARASSSANAPFSVSRAASSAPSSSPLSSSAAAKASSSPNAPFSMARSSSLSPASSSAAPPLSSSRPASSAVRASSSAAAASPSAKLTVDANGGTCGKGTTYTCVSTECCSQYGYCGTSAAYCGTGCQKGFGKCN